MAVSTIGRSVPRIEGAAKVTGGEPYAADVTIPGSLHARVLRSTVGHARINGIDTSRAKALPGVHAVLTGADVSNVYVGQRLKDMPLLAIDQHQQNTDDHHVDRHRDEEVLSTLLDLPARVSVVRARIMPVYPVIKRRP